MTVKLIQKQSNDDPSTDIFGCPVFIGSHVVTVVSSQGHTAYMRYGTVTEFNEVKQQVKVTGGNCGKPLWRYPNELVVLLGKE